MLADFASPKHKDKACDLCTGCGIIPLLWCANPNGCQDITCADIQPEACELVARSIELNELQDRVSCLRADIRKPDARLTAGVFDVVTVNPPYNIPGTGAPSREESSLTARHEVLCTIDDAVNAGARLLKFGGRMCMCHKPQRLSDLIFAFRSRGCEPKRLRFVQQTGESEPWLVLIEGKKGAKTGLRVLPPLLMTQNGEKSQEYKKIYSSFYNNM